MIDAGVYRLLLFHPTHPGEGVADDRDHRAVAIDDGVHFGARHTAANGLTNLLVHLAPSPAAASSADGRTGSTDVMPDRSMILISSAGARRNSNSLPSSS